MAIKVFTDIHHAPTDSVVDRGSTKLSTQTLPLLGQHFRRSSTEILSLCLGDLITCARDGTLSERQFLDLNYLYAVMPVMAACGIQFTLPGNHEDQNLGRDTLNAVANDNGLYVGSVSLYHSGMTVIMWAPDTSIRKENGGTMAVSRADIAWLKAALTMADHNAIVLTHMPLDGDLTDFSRSAVDGHRNPGFGYGSRLPYAAYYPNAPYIRSILETSGKVMACFAGHTHWNEARTSGGIAYITLPSLVEQFPGTTDPWEGTATLDFDPLKRILSVDVGGLSPVHYDIAPDNISSPLTIKQGLHP